MQNKEELIRKLFNDQCSKDELESLFDLIRNDSSDTSPEILEELIRQRDNIPDYEEAIFDKIKQKIDAKTTELDNTSTPVITLPSTKRSSQLWLVRIAASILLLATMSWLVFQFVGDDPIREKTAFGEIKTIKLPDGSKVTLNGNSTLQYSENWKPGEIRKVFLQGEAFFEVEKKPATNAKFQVITEGLTVEVLGTSFNVNHRNKETSVFLEEGKVKLKAEESVEKEVLLNPGEIIHYSAKKKDISRPKVISGTAETSWKTGLLKFENATVLEILNRLSEFNELQFEILDESLQNEIITTAIPINDLGETLSVLAKTAGMTVSKKENKFIFLPLTD